MVATALRASAAGYARQDSDEAEVRGRRCGCPLQARGWTTHLQAIRSPDKLSPGGMTLMDADLVRAPEHVLPRRYGGGPTDYQLVEDEGEGGRLRLRLLVHPAVGPLDASAVAATFLDAIGTGSGVERLTGLVWREAGLQRGGEPARRTFSSILRAVRGSRVADRLPAHRDHVTEGGEYCRRQLPRQHGRELVHGGVGGWPRERRRRLQDPFAQVHGLTHGPLRRSPRPRLSGLRQGSGDGPARQLGVLPVQPLRDDLVGLGQVSVDPRHEVHRGLTSLVERAEKAGYDAMTFT